MGAEAERNLRVRWLAQAAAELAHEVGRINGQRGQDEAAQFLYDVNRQVGLLATYPHLGRAGRVEGTRELLMHDRKWLVAYRVIADAEVQVLAFIHAKRGDIERSIRQR